jgi:pimeloyl-ACP methyl ester carboxylesterase
MLCTVMRIARRALEVAWWGPATGSLPIVLLHEGLGSVSMWRQFPEALAARTARRVMAYSRFGHGRSDPPEQPHTIRFMHDEAALLPQILDACGIARAILFGHSDGGSIALIAAAHDSRRVAGLVLEAAHVFVEDVSVESVERTTAAFASGDLRARLARHHDNVDLAFRGWSDVWLDPEFRSWNLEALLPRVVCPVLVIQGEQDEYGTVRQVEAIAAQVTGPVQPIVLPACGHSPHRDRPEDVLAAVAAFAGSTRARP